MRTIFSIATVAGCSLLFLTSCGVGEPVPCYASAYADLSRWSIFTLAKLHYHCDGSAIGADVSNLAGTSSIARGSFYGAAGGVAWVEAFQTIASGSGKLSASLWEDAPIGAGGPGEGGRVLLHGRSTSGTATITFLGQTSDTSPIDFTWHIERVSVREIEVIR